MTLRLGDTVPNFTQASTHGDINFYEWAGDSTGCAVFTPC